MISTCQVHSRQGVIILSLTQHAHVLKTILRHALVRLMMRYRCCSLHETRRAIWQAGRQSGRGHNLAAGGVGGAMQQPGMLRDPKFVLIRGAHVQRARRSARSS